jgi:ribulose-5-phosphate 4-epimerase/fuculose-1-phosphate aldolase
MIEIYNQVIEMGKSIQEYVEGPEGNVSILHEQNIYIKGSGEDTSKLNSNSISICDLKSGEIKNGVKPSMELGFHRWIYQNSEFTHISHSHPVNTVAVLCSRSGKDFSELRLFPDHAVFNLSKSCFVPYSNPGEELVSSISKSVEGFIAKYNYFPNTILLQNHGLISLGNSVYECNIVSRICEKAANIFIKSLSISGENKIIFISEKNIEKILLDVNEKHRQNLLKNKK